MSPEPRDALDHILRSPGEEGPLEMIVARPGPDRRETPGQGELDPGVGLVGDDWSRRPSSRTPDRSPHPGRQITLMSTRVAAAVAGARERWPLAGDQLMVDLDLSESNLPAGSHLAIGDALLEMTDQEHLGCRKFVERFGREAMAFVGSRRGRELRLRGAYARVVRAGSIRVGDPVRVLSRGPIPDPGAERTSA